MTVGTFNYVERSQKDPVFYTEDQSRGNLQLDPHTVPVGDIRKIASPSLDHEGFLILDLPFTVGETRDIEAVEKAYNPPLAEALKALTGAARMILMPPLLRWSDKTPHPEFENSIPARYVHCDYTRESFHQLMANMIADDPERDRWLSGRYAAINTWRALSPPPQDLPLAVIDRSTIHLDDMIQATVVIDGATEMRFPQSIPVYNPAHRWHYISDMTASDTLVFMGFDSESDLPGNPHSAFDNDCQDAIPRSSAEVRAFLYWGD